MAASPIDPAPASSWSGKRVSQYGSRFFSIPVSEATLSASATKPQLHIGNRLAVGEQSLHRYVDMAEFARHPRRSADHAAGLDDAAPEAGADDRRDRGTQWAPRSRK